MTVDRLAELEAENTKLRQRVAKLEEKVRDLESELSEWEELNESL